MRRLHENQQNGPGPFIEDVTDQHSDSDFDSDMPTLHGPGSFIEDVIDQHSDSDSDYDVTIAAML